MLVYRPTDPARFNGTVILEWLNVSGGVDAATDWVVLHNELIRGGYAWVGISAQKMGVDGGVPPASPLPIAIPLKLINPLRYASLVHPGDRSEEHTSELQSLMRISYAVFCLKKKIVYNH